MAKTKDFNPTGHHRLCSSHFKGGKKRNSDIPSVFPLLPLPKSRKEPKFREYIPPKKVKRVISAEPKTLADRLVEEKHH